MDHDFQEHNEKISGNVPIYFMTGVYDFACTPEITEETAKKVKGSEAIVMEGIGHFPMSENPAVYKEYLMPVLEKILTAQGEPAGERPVRRQSVRADQEHPV